MSKNVAIELVANKTDKPLDAFVQSVKERNPMLSDLTDWLYDYRMAFGDVPFDTLLAALNKPTETTETKRNGKATREAMVVFMSGKPFVSFRELCKNCGPNMSEQNVRHHLNILIEYGAVEQVDRGFYALTSAFEG